MEYLDIYDNEGKLTGEKALRKDAHDKGLWHKAVHIWIVNSKGEVLIQKRSPQKDNHPNMWDISAAGHVLLGDDDLISAQRETEEEIGLKLNIQDLTQIGTIKTMSSREGYINNEINPVYIVKTELNPEKIIKQEEEVSEVKFIDYKELKKLIEDGDTSFVCHNEEYNLLFNYIENNL